MTDNIVSIVPMPKTSQKPNKNLIAFLEDHLELAKSGELQAIAGACRFNDGCTYHVMGYAGGFDFMGALQYASLSLANVIPDDEE